MGQSEFKYKSFTVSEQNDNKLKQNFKTYKSYEINIAEIKAHIRTTKKGKLKPIEFYLILDNDKVKFNLFENDIFDDSYFYNENGKKKGQDKNDLNTFAGYVGDDSKNVLRLFISDRRISGFFKYNGIDYVIGHLADYGVLEKGNPNKFEIIIAKAEDEISQLSGMHCGLKNNIAKTGRVAATAGCSEIVCKYFKLAISTDYEFYSQLTKITSTPIPITLGTNPQDVLIDMVNRMDLIYFRDLGLRIKLVATDIPTNVNDPYTITTTDGNSILQHFQNNSPLRFVDRDVLHFLTGRRMGVYQSPQPDYQFGQANQGFFAINQPLAQSLSTVSKFDIYYEIVDDVRRNNIIPLSYSDSYSIMAHEIGHVIGADHPSGADCSPTKSIMCFGEGKGDSFVQFSIDQIRCFMENPICTTYLNNRTVTSGFSNFMTLQLNGVNTSTPMFINNNPKTLAIANNPPYTLLNSSFSANDSRVIMYSTTLNQQQFSINTAPSFTMAVTAQDECNNYQSNVFFVYSPSGARVATNAFPNPISENLNLEDIYLDNIMEGLDISPINKVNIYSENGSLIQETVIEIEQKHKFIDTKNIKNGLYYMHILRLDGTMEVKRIKIEHQ